MQSYQDALATAVRAAEAAGELLRREFHREGGPRGNRHKTPSDMEAEDLIRRMLTEAFPDFGFRAEERPDENRLPRDADSHYWLVDPNDGTSAFFNGERGASVSIGLIRGDQPVLGVVYAYAAPDDGGDLIAWARGCGPVRRNGQPVEAPRWPTALTRAHTILASHRADMRAQSNGQFATPARYRTVPGIAYRLALAAAGEAEAACSIIEPQDYDVAGGHALVIGAGGELVDEVGRPIRYRPDQSVGMAQCFASGAELARKLASREWSLIHRVPVDPPVPYDLTRPERGHVIEGADLLCRAQGALLGQLAGDSLGSLVEFQSPGQIAARYPDGPRLLADGGTWDTLAGQPTDDSELALMLARSLAEQGRFDEEAVARAYAFWYRSDPFDMGGTTARALSAADSAESHDRPVAKAARAAADYQSQANGALMRVSPLGIFGHALRPERLAGLARADARLTHPNPVCQDASAVYAVTLAHAITTGADRKELYAYALRFARERGLHDDILETLTAAASGPPADYTRQQGWVRLALQNAYFQLLHAPSLEHGVVDTVARGGDTDTNAAIAGALLGAAWGRAAIPRQWQDRVLTCRPQAALGAVHPRPKAFWPVDALVLAERLLVCGLRAVEDFSPPTHDTEAA